MENVIETGAVTELDNQYADAGEQQEMAQESAVVSLSEILSEAQDNDAGSPDAGEAAGAEETVVNERDDGAAPQADLEPKQQPQAVYRTQAEFDAAFSKRMANERARNRPYVEMGQTVMDLAGNELTSDEVKAAISQALAEKRSKAYNTDFETEMNNIRVEQRVAQRTAPRQQAVQNAPQPAEDSRARADEMLATMNAIGDGAFTVQALTANKEAMTAWSNGASPAEVYRKYFAGAPATPVETKPAADKPRRPAPERAANSGAMGSPQRRFSKADIEKIDKAIEARGGVALY